MSRFDDTPLVLPTVDPSPPTIQRLLIALGQSPWADNEPSAVRKINNWLESHTPSPVLRAQLQSRGLLPTTSPALPPQFVDNLVPDDGQPLVGREALLAEAIERLGTPSAVLGLVGEGGSGKSTLALAAARHFVGSRTVWWLDAANEASLVAGYVRLAEALGRPATNSGPEQARGLVRWLSQTDDWLLVLDDIQTAIAPELIPTDRPEGSGRVIATSRAWSKIAPAWAGRKPLKIQVGPLTREASMDLLRLEANRRSLNLSDARANDYADLAAGSPLLLQVLVSAHMTVKSAKPQNTTGKILERGVRGLRENDPQSWALLLRLSAAPNVLWPDRITHALAMGVGASRSGVDMLVQSRLVRRLGDTLNVHPAVAKAMQSATEPSLRAQARADVAASLKQQFPADPYDLSSWSSFEELLPILRPLSDAAAPGDPGTTTLTACVLAASRYLQERDQLDDALQLARKARALLQEGEPGRRLSSSLARAVLAEGQLLLATRDVAGAAERATVLRAMADRLPSHDAAVADAFHLEGLIAVERGRPAEARQYFLQAINAESQRLAPRGRELARFRGEVAQLDFSGDPHRAVRLFRSALEDLRGTDTRDEEAWLLAGLGRAQQLTDDHNAAERSLRTALELELLAVGERHTRTAARQRDLARLLLSLGDVPAATSLLAKALRTYQDALGHQHIEVAQTLVSVGRAQRKSGELFDAQDTLKLALKMPSVATRPELRGQVIAALGRTMLDLGELEQAEQCLSEASEVLERERGPQATSTAAARRDLATTLLVLGRADSARRTITDAIEELGCGNAPTPARLCCTLQLARSLATFELGDRVDAMRTVEAVTADLSMLPAGRRVDSSRGHHLLAMFLAVEGRFVDSADQADKAMSLLPDVGYPLERATIQTVQAAVSFLRDPRSELAGEALIRAQERVKELEPGGAHPLYASALGNRAAALLSMGHVDEARESFAIAARHWRDLAPVGQHAARRLLEANRKSASIGNWRFEGVVACGYLLVAAVRATVESVDRVNQEALDA
jgi:tetratricopeptide (TPR) repeat protein